MDFRAPQAQARYGLRSVGTSSSPELDFLIATAGTATFATWAIESGAREIDVQMLLGHADLTMTQRYARAYTSEQAVRAHASLSPVARLSPPE